MLRNVKVGTRVQAGFAFIGSAMVVSAAVAIGGMAMINDHARLVYNDRVIPMQELKFVADGYAVAIVDNTQKMRAGTVSIADGVATIKRSQLAIDSAWTSYAQHQLSADEKALAATAESTVKRANAAIEKLMAILARNDSAALVVFAEQELYPAIDPVSDALSKLIDVQVKVAAAEFADGESIYTMFRLAAIIGTLLLFLTALGIGRWTARYLSRGTGGLVAQLESLRSEQIPRLRQGAVAMADGDLATPDRLRGGPAPGGRRR
jgi:methyl-accepting chemotaxis protein